MKNLSSHAIEPFLDIASTGLQFARWVVERSRNSPLHDDLQKHALVALAWNEGCEAHWRRLASWTLTDLSPSDELTAEESEMRALAQQIFDSEIRIAARLGLDLYPPDSEDALERALEVLRPCMTNEGEPQ